MWTYGGIYKRKFSNTNMPYIIITNPERVSKGNRGVRNSKARLKLELEVGISCLGNIVDAMLKHGGASSLRWA